MSEASERACESLRHQVASAQSCWKDAEHERLQVCVCVRCVRVCARVCGRACGSYPLEEEEEESVSRILTLRSSKRIPSSACQLEDKVDTCVSFDSIHMRQL